jgi:glycosyltransferase involved in cell wall biosynthesis
MQVALNSALSATTIDPSNIEGAVDTLTRWGATGWAWLPGAPHQSVTIEAEADGKIVGRALADQMRHDLAQDGRGIGCYGFTLMFNGFLTNESPPILRAIGPSGAVELPVSKWSDVEGYVDSITRWGAIGWVWMPSAPDRAIEVEAVLNDKVIGRAFADQVRQDIASSGRGDGRYGFTLSSDEPFTSQHFPTIRALGPGEPTILRSPDKAILGEPEAAFTKRPDIAPPPETTAASGNIEGAVDSVTRWGASGWGWLPAAPDHAVTIEAVLDGRIVGQAIADQMRPDLAEHGKGTGRYGFILAFTAPLTGNKAPVLRGAGSEGHTILPGPTELPPEAQTEFTDANPLVLSAIASSATIGTSPNAAASLPGIDGHIDNLTRWDASGWAWLPVAPELALMLEAVLGGRVIGRTIANQFRSDLAEHGKGTGLYGFKIVFEEPVTGNEVPEIRGLVPSENVLPGSKTLPRLTSAEKFARPRGSLTALLNEHAQFTSSGPEFEDFDPAILSSGQIAQSACRPLLLAFYLPQFHAIPENDHFWGKGFTEWRQLPRGIARFPGHYQPRIPRDLGFYNLTHLDDMRAQVKLAKAAAINAFAFYYYWFNRQRVLEKPLELLLASDLEMPFLIIWANENWTRTWDGSESEVLLGQDYKPEDEEALIEDLARHFVDPRYVRINNRPLFIIYNPKNIPDAVVTIARWRSKLSQNFSVDPLIFMAQTFGENDPGSYGIDGAMEFPPHKLSNKLPGRQTPDAYSQEFAGRVIAYDDFVSASLDDHDPDFHLIKTIVPSWDNDARRPNRGLTLEGLSPRKYEAWLKELISRAIENPIFETPIVAINAWNEWAESAYLEPDVYYGSAFLNATARAYVAAVNEHDARPSPESGVSNRRAVSVIFPNYNHARYLPERIMSVIRQTLPPDEIIFLDDCSSDDSVNVARELLQASNIPYQIVVNTENSGGVFRQWIKGMALAKNDLIWIAETDDSADPTFLQHVTAGFSRDDVMASFGRILCIDQNGAPRNDLDAYFNGLKDFSWNSSKVVPAHRAFLHDFAITNVIANASALVFRKPQLTSAEVERLYEYKFAGDWYFYALVARGGAIAYCRKARSMFRINQSSTSRSAFFSDRHLAEHKMVIDDLWKQYGIGGEVINTHADALARHFPDRGEGEVRQFIKRDIIEGTHKPPHICIAAHSFEVGGGEVLPLELANELKGRGFHVTYLVVERPAVGSHRGIRPRLRSDIPVVWWQDIADSFGDFVCDYGIDVINSHNVSVEFQLYLRHVKVGIPYIGSLHGGYETVPGLLTPDFVSYLNATVTKWLYLADKNKKILLDHGVSADNLQTSFNAVPEYRGEWIDRREFRDQHRIGQDAFVLILCSRAIEEKGWLTAIRVVAEINKEMPASAHLVLIGDGPVAAHLQKENVDSPFVTFLGHVDNPIRYFRCFDIGIFPSTFSGETFPLFILECFQLGLPVISTDIGEIPRIMGDNPDTRPGATVDCQEERDVICRDMTRIIRAILADKNSLEILRANAYTVSKRFSLIALGDLYSKLSTDLIADRRVRPAKTDQN